MNFFDWAFAREILPRLLDASLTTIGIALAGFAIAVVLGLFLAIGRRSRRARLYLGCRKRRAGRRGSGARGGRLLGRHQRGAQGRHGGDRQQFFHNGLLVGTFLQKKGRVKLALGQCKRKRPGGQRLRRGLGRRRSRHRGHPQPGRDRGDQSGRPDPGRGGGLLDGRRHGLLPGGRTRPT